MHPRFVHCTCIQQAPTCTERTNEQQNRVAHYHCVIYSQLSFDSTKHEARYLYDRRRHCSHTVVEARCNRGWLETLCYPASGLSADQPLAWYFIHAEKFTTRPVLGLNACKLNFSSALRGDESDKWWCRCTSERINRGQIIFSKFSQTKSKKSSFIIFF